MEFHRGRLIDHVHLFVSNLEASRRFYRGVLGALGRELSGESPRHFFADELFVTPVESGDLPTSVHLAFQATDRETVQRFHEAALASGGTDNGGPGLRPYHPGYFAAYALDPDGNNIECVFHGPFKRSAPSVVIQALLLLIVSTSASLAWGAGPVIRYVNPEGMAKSPAFTQAISVDGPHRTIYIGAQDPIDQKGQTVALGDLAGQTEQVFKNLKLVLAAEGLDLSSVIKWNIYLVHGQSPQGAMMVFAKEWGNRPNPPTLSLSYVAALAHPDYLVELEAVAVGPSRAKR